MSLGYQSRAWNCSTRELLLGRHRSSSSSMKSTSFLSIFSCLKMMNGIQNLASYKNVLEFHLVNKNAPFQISPVIITKIIIVNQICFFDFHKVKKTFRKLFSQIFGPRSLEYYLVYQKHHDIESFVIQEPNFFIES